MARLVTVARILVLTAVLLAGCGGRGGEDREKVEASLQHYLSTLDPQQSLGQTRPAVGVFPIGAGTPRVRENSCKKIHPGKVPPARAGKVHPARRPEGPSGWSCVVRFGKSPLPVAVAVKGSGEVYWAAPVSRQALPPARVYEGNP
jgi:hypothetical protein